MEILTGFKFRDIEKQGVHSVLTINKDKDMAVIRDPQGMITEKKISEIEVNLRNRKFFKEPAIPSVLINHRIWVFSTKKMYDTVTGISVHSGGYRIQYAAEDNTLKSIRVSAENMVAMAHVGIELNQKKVFSLDIIEMPDVVMHTHRIIMPFEDGYRLYYINKSGYEVANFGSLIMRGAKVIGNIFEQPEYYDLFVKHQ